MEVKQAADRPEAAAVDTRQTHFAGNLKHFCLSLCSDTREHADLICFVMRPRSTSRRSINIFLLLLLLLLIQ